MSTLMLVWLVPILFALLLVASCHDSVTGPRQERVPLGTWGSEMVGVEVAASRATVQFSCASGEIDQPIFVDRNGRFDTAGTYVVEIGPIRPDSSHPARFSGRVEGSQMTLTVAVVDSNQVLGPFSLRFGVQFVGPFCARPLAK